MDDTHDGSYAREPQLDDLVRLARALNAHHARYVLIGGFAVIAHGEKHHPPVRRGRPSVPAGAHRRRRVRSPRLRPGDVIVTFNGTAVTDGGQLSRMVQDTTIGSTATVAVVREGRRMELKVPIQSTTQ